MRISDWSSDVCSSDLGAQLDALAAERFERVSQQQPLGVGIEPGALDAARVDGAPDLQPPMVLGHPQKPRRPRDAPGRRSEEGRVGKGGVRTCRYRWSP